MISPAPIKPTHKAIRAYYEKLEGYSAQDVSHEMGLRSAFQQLLEQTGKSNNWTLIPEQKVKVGGKTVRPDGTFRDEWHLPCGYWEAKDTDDDLNAEIRLKIGKGYPLTNTIFEDTREAVLFQNGLEALRVPLSHPAKLADLLNAFYTHTKPDIEGFKQAVDHFKEHIPDLARALNERIVEAHKTNTKFKTAFADFFELCQQSLNPNIRREAVDEMLVQHLLTERLFRTVFDNADFTKRNVIAVEIERVIEALASQSFSRSEFLRKLDHFYKAIEDAAHGLEDWSDKQHFLNTVYERFFQGYSVKVADTHGIVYTPQEIVDFMCASVEEVLKTEFGLGLGDPRVNILDPCTGTGNFIVNMIRRIPKKDLPRVYREQLFANEVMLLPYYIAAMNIEHAYYERTGAYEPFEGLCFVDTLGLAEGDQKQLSFMTEKNTERVEHQKKARINVIIGNPPYNVGQLNENDNNKNRRYPIIDGRVKDTYAKDSKATSVSKINDPYVKFLRWATDRLQGRDGIVCFVSNNSFVDQIAFDGMRKHLHQDFARIHHIDLHGNVRKNPKLSGTTHNVFGIQVGVGITVAVLSSNHKARRLFYHRVPESMRREEKLQWLAERNTLSGVEWQSLAPDRRNTWLVPEHADEFASFMPLVTRRDKTTHRLASESIFELYSLGVTTNRDDVVFDFARDRLVNRIRQFSDDYNSEVDRYRRSGATDTVDNFVRYDRIKWSETLKLHLQRGNYAAFEEAKIRESLYRPYCKMYIFFDMILNERLRSFPVILPTHASQIDNQMIVTSDIGFRANSFSTLVTNRICECHLCASTDGHQCFPFYVYDEDGSNRRENITDWALNQFRQHYEDDSIGKLDIFYYVYGSLHLPSYRQRFADNLKKELPRIPFLADFRAVAEAGKRLAALHLGYENVEPWPVEWVYTEGNPLSYRVEKMKLSSDKTTLKVNDSLTLAGIPPEVFRYRLGNRSALDWVIDQYQVNHITGPGGDRVSGPNRPDDPQYIVRLVGQVVRVSMETMALIDSLPPWPETALSSTAQP